MDFKLSREQAMIQRAAREFSRKAVEPISAQLDQTGRVPDDMLKALAKLGFFGMTVPKTYGGTAAGDFAAALVIEQLAYCGCPVWWPVAFNNSLPQTICRFGTQAQKAQYVKGRMGGDQVYSIQFTEPQTGSDPSALTTTARQQGKAFILNGQKRFSTFGARKGIALVWANVEDKGCTCFIVEKFSPGYAAPKVWDLVGSGGAEAADVYYTDMTVPADGVLGDIGNGFPILLYWIALEKLQGCIAALALGKAALDEAVNYTKARQVAGAPMAAMQGIRFELADMYAKIEACRWMTYRSVHLAADDAKAFQKEAAACKLAVQPLITSVIETAFRLHGGYAYTKDYKIERLFRAQLGNSVISTGLEINKSIVASALLK